MRALNLQYTAYKEMLLAEVKGDISFYCVRKERDGSITIHHDDVLPGSAAEAFLFCPPGYWKTVYDNELFPDDYPTDLLPSMSGGAAKTHIPNTYTDGMYLMLYCIGGLWYGLRFTVRDDVIYRVNDTDVSHYPIGQDAYPDQARVAAEILVDDHAARQIDAAVTVIRHDGEEIDAELFVIYTAESSLDAELDVWFVGGAAMDAELYIYNREDLDAEMTVKYTVEVKLEAQITIKRDVAIEVDSAVFVWFEGGAAMDAEIFVTYCEDLGSEIAVRVKAIEELDGLINIQRIVELDLDGEIMVKRWGEGDPLLLPAELCIVYFCQYGMLAEIAVEQTGAVVLPSMLDITARTVAIDLVSHAVEVAVAARAELGGTIYIPAGGQCAAAMQNAAAAGDALPSEIDLIDFCTAGVDSSVIILTANALAAAAGVLIRGQSGLRAAVQVANNGEEQLTAEIAVCQADQAMQVVMKRIGTFAQLDAAIEVTGIQKMDLSCGLVLCDAVNPSCMAAALRKNISYQQGELNAELTLIAPLCAELDAELYVKPQGTVIDTAVRNIANDNAVLDAEMEVVKRVREDFLQCAIGVCAQSRYDNKITVLRGSKQHIAAELVVASDSQADLSAGIFILPRNEMTGICGVLNYAVNELPAEVAVYQSSELASCIYIHSTPTVLELNNILAKPRIKTRETAAVKDAVCYSYTSIINYGYLEEIAVGNFTAGENFKSAIGFDFTALAFNRNESYDYFGYDLVTKAVLRLYVTRPARQAEIRLSVYELADNWFEKSLNYRILSSLPKGKLVGQTMLPRKSGWFDVDVTASLTDIEHESDRKSYLLLVDNPIQVDRNGIYFSSREGVHAPKLTVSYYSTPPNFDYTELDCALAVNPSSEINAEISVVFDTFAEMDGSIEIPKADRSCEIEAALEIIGPNLTTIDLPSEIELFKKFVESETEAEIELFKKYAGSETTADITVTVVNRPYVFIT